MADLILGSEVSEFVANRQNAKIQFLQQENMQLQDQVKDLEKALHLNKDILKITMGTSKVGSNNSTDVTNTSVDAVNKSLIKKLHDESLLLSHQLKKMTEERNLAQNKLLLQQQIAEESTSFYKDLIQDLEDKVQELRRCIYDKEYAIQEIEKCKATFDSDGQMIKIREVEKIKFQFFLHQKIVTPNEQTLRLHEELESTRLILNKISNESQNLSDQNNLLQDTNFNFKRELIKLRIVLRSPVAYFKMKQFIYDDFYGNTDENLELQNEIYANPGFVLGEYDANINQNNNQILQQYGYASQSQMKYLSSNERAIYQDKLTKSESLLKGFKELFEKEKNKNQLLSTRFNEIQRAYVNLEETNNILVKAIKGRDQRIEKLQSEVAYYRKQYGNYINLLKNKRRVNLSFEKGQEGNLDQKRNILRLQQRTPQVKSSGAEFRSLRQNGNPKIDRILTEVEDDMREVNVSILDEQEIQFDQAQEDSKKSQFGSENIDDQVEEQSEPDEHSSHSDDQDEQQEIEDLKIPRKNFQQSERKFKGLTIQTEHDQDSVQKKYTTTTKHKSEKNQNFSKQTQYQMSVAECKQFLLNSAKELYLTYNLRMNNLQRKQLLGQETKDFWNVPQGIWHQKSSSDPLDYFTGNYQDLELKQAVLLKQEQQENDILRQNLMKKQNTKNQPVQGTISNANNPFYLDVSLIQNQKGEQKKKNTKKVTINAELSFISNNDNLLEGIQQ